MSNPEHAVRHTAHHFPGYAKGCVDCDHLYAGRQRRILRAASIVRDSCLRHHTPGAGSSSLDRTFERAAVALAYVDEVGVEYATAEDLDNRYRGVWGSFGDFVEDLIESTDALQGASDVAARYFDYEKFGRDLLLGGDYSTAPVDNGSYQIVVFSGA